MSDQSILRIRDLRKSFGQHEILKGVSFDVKPKDVIVLVGPSGTGKSTLLQCLNLLTRPTGGQIWLEDQEITAPRTDVDKVRQRMGMAGAWRFSFARNVVPLLHRSAARGSVPVRARGRSRPRA